MAEIIASGIYITAENYAEFIRESELLKNVMTAIYTGACLSWNKKELSLDSGALEGFLKVADSRRYWDIYSKLKAEDEKEVNDETV